MKLRAGFYPEAQNNEVQKYLHAHREFTNQDPLDEELKE